MVEQQIGIMAWDDICDGTSCLALFSVRPDGAGVVRYSGPGWALCGEEWGNVSEVRVYPPGTYETCPVTSGTGRLIYRP